MTNSVFVINLVESATLSDKATEILTYLDNVELIPVAI